MILTSLPSRKLVMRSTGPPKLVVSRLRSRLTGICVSRSSSMFMFGVRLLAS
ncbi:hypothetical protein G6O69_38915 [Pseudenhygromyxa sp. WMMC2535]|uniref:hypothetical protein n=1 Tax=Pseudenhygromyxa sp. WMMC2535 TaxID=2712867 RepID=UPI0015950376|nr:hypothetical protein [Pseudenhygromyxa sp. WMMC2535]NVB43831.1 hypothetical protein [Pseudenhygromyxa sp. WMMC2535]